MEVAVSFIVLFLIIVIFISIHRFYLYWWRKIVYKYVKPKHGVYVFNKHALAEYITLFGAILFVGVLVYFIYTQWEVIYHYAAIETRIISIIIGLVLLLRVLMTVVESIDQYQNRNDQLIISPTHLTVHDNEHHIEYELFRITDVERNKKINKSGVLTFKYDGYTTHIDLYDLNLTGYKKQIFTLLIELTQAKS